MSGEPPRPHATPPQPGPALNIFAFPSETDARFLLLVLIAAAGMVGLGIVVADAYLGFVLESMESAARTLLGGAAGLALTLLLFALSVRRARRMAAAQIRREGWEPFPPESGDPLERASFDHMARYLQAVMSAIPEVARRPPRMVWNRSSVDRDRPAGMAFGFGADQYVCLNEGLHAAFVNRHSSRTFDAVVLHELAHVANRDVGKTTFSIALGRVFTALAITLAGLLNGYVVIALLERIASQRALDGEVWAGVAAITRITVSAALLLILVEVARSSVLRVREYHADARARAWMGDPEVLVEVLGASVAPSEGNHAARTDAPSAAALAIVAPAGRTMAQRRWETLKRWLRRRLAPLHPRHDQRVAALRHPWRLFQLDAELALLAGALIGLSLNSSMAIFSIMHVLTGLMSSINAQAQVSEAMGALLIRVAIFLVVMLLWVGIALTIVVGFAVMPAARTLGLQLQKAALADRIQASGARTTSLRRMAPLALMMGIGIVLGAALTPVPGALSLYGASWLLAPLYVLAWAAVILTWMLPLSWLASRLLGAHQGGGAPSRKRACLTLLSGLALTPTLLVMMLTQTSATLATGSFPGFSWNGGGPFRLFGAAWLIALALTGLIWLSGGVLMALAGWLRPAPCAVCGAPARTRGVALNCGQCGSPCLAWALLPRPLSLPTPPAPVIVQHKGPPPVD